MLGRIAFLVLVLATGGSVSAPLPANAKDLPIDAFFGTYSGSGVAHSADSVYFTVTKRDFDVVINPQGNGFKVEWTSVIRGGDDPAKPKIRRRKTTKILLPTGASGVFRGTQKGDLLDGKELHWARIDQNTLSVFLMSVNSKGIYELQQYDRTLSGREMTLLFRSWRDGDRLRSVSGHLTRKAR